MQVQENQKNTQQVIEWVPRINKSKSKSMYQKSCCEHKHTQAGNEALSKVSVTKPIVQAQITNLWH